MVKPATPILMTDIKSPAVEAVKLAGVVAVPL
jgi:hypothetical protein